MYIVWGHKLQGRDVSRYFIEMVTFEIKKLFLSAAHFAVVGASKDQSKYGTKVSEGVGIFPQNSLIAGGIRF
jgi:hypothetical protein